ncbi:E3 ubiquitin--protein ligase, partial [Escherichia coli]|nr:E3 ubiquitin--protein ligase [Escherichia coli]
MKISDNYRVYTVDNTTRNILTYEAVWSAWERAAPPEEAADRASVIQQLYNIRDGKTSYLDLFYLDISSLPDHLPDGLLTLNITGTQLTKLPALPDGLHSLQITETPLTELPALPDGLHTLGITTTPLTALPALPDGLHTLDIKRTPLTALPALPGGLVALCITTTPLTELPEIPGRVWCMEVINTEITRLPESILRLSPNSVVYLYDNPLSVRTRQTLQTILNTRDYSGPRIFFSMDDSSTPREVRPLHQAVADWLMPAEDGGPAPADSWQLFEQENDAASFSAFLDRLKETENSKKVSGFKAQVSSWLTQLAED